MKTINWEEQASAVIKTALKAKGMSYPDLAAALASRGIIQSVANIKQKMHNGTFSFVFALQSLDAIENFKR